MVKVIKKKLARTTQPKQTAQLGRTARKKRAAQPKRAGKESFAQRALTSLEEFVADVRSGRKITVRTTKLPLAPGTWLPIEIRELRDRYGVSQTVFAGLLAVDVETIRAWEQGKRKPTPIANRLLDEVARDPDHWRTKIEQAS